MKEEFEGCMSRGLPVNDWNQFTVQCVHKFRGQQRAMTSSLVTSLKIREVIVKYLSKLQVDAKLTLSGSKFTRTAKGVRSASFSLAK